MVGLMYDDTKLLRDRSSRRFAKLLCDFAGKARVKSVLKQMLLCLTCSGLGL